MLSVIIPTLNAASHLERSLPPLATVAAAGLVREVIISDGGSSDATLAIAEAAGARIVQGPGGRALQLQAGADAAKGPWLLFLHADTALAPGWEEVARGFMAQPGQRAAAFRFECDDSGPAARSMVRWVERRCRWFGLPYGDQGLLISQAFFESLGGFQPLPFLEDVDIVRRIGRRRLSILPSLATTSTEKYRRDGYRRRSLRNLLLVSLYFMGVSPHRLAKHYD